MKTLNLLCFVVRKRGSWSGLRVSLDHQITSWGNYSYLISLRFKWEAKQVEESGVIG